MNDDWTHLSRYWITIYSNQLRGIREIRVWYVYVCDKHIAYIGRRLCNVSKEYRVKICCMFLCMKLYTLAHTRGANSSICCLLVALENCMLAANIRTTANKQIGKNQSACHCTVHNQQECLLVFYSCTPETLISQTESSATKYHNASSI